MRIYTVAYLDRNLGDDLMIRLMAKSMPQHDFYLYIDKRSNMIPFMNLKNVHSTDIPFDKSFDPKKFDGVVVIGGSIFMLIRRLYAIERIRDKFPVFRKILKAGLPLATVGCNLGPFRDAWCERVACRELGMSGLATVRDSKSFETMKKYGYNVKLFPDMLFSLDIPYVPPKHREKILGISAYRSTMLGGECTDYYESMAETADCFVDKTGGGIRLFAFDCEGENDICAAYTIRRLMKNKRSCEIIVYDGDTEEFIEKFDGCSSMIATRFHSMVLAQLSGIPVLPMVYSNKMTDTLDDLNYSGVRLEYGKPIPNVDEITQLLLEHEKLLRLNREQLQKLSHEAAGHMDALREYLDSAGQKQN